MDSTFQTGPLALPAAARLARQATVFGTLPIVILTLMMLALYAYAERVDSLALQQLFNATLPAVLLVGCLGNVYLLLRSNPLMIWSPMVWFLLTCGVYYGFGSLIYHYGSAASVQYCDEFSVVTEEQLTRSNLLNALGIMTVSLAFEIVLRLFPVARTLDYAKLDLPVIRRCLLFYVLLGVVAKYSIILPYNFGLLKFVLPGSIYALNTFTNSAVTIAVFLTVRGYRQYRGFTVLLVVAELGISLFTFSKMESLLTLVAITLGLFMARPRQRLLVTSAAVVAVTYLIISPLVTLGRASLTNREKGLGGRYETLVETTQNLGERGAQDGESHQAWWTRLNFAQVQTFALDLYDHDEVGDSFQLISYTFIPRILWPEKPFMNPGLAFNEMITGQDTSNSSPTIFAEAYWNGGWSYVGWTCIYVGLLFAIFTKIAERMFSRFDFRWLPCASMAVVMGARPDDWFAAMFVGTLPILFGFWLLIWMLLPAPRVRA